MKMKIEMEMKSKKKKMKAKMKRERKKKKPSCCMGLSSTTAVEYTPYQRLAEQIE
jgi:hypothetical protein